MAADAVEGVGVRVDEVVALSFGVGAGDHHRGDSAGIEALALAELHRHSKLYQFLGVQTDYSEEGKGIISPEMIKSILDEALEIA